MSLVGTLMFSVSNETGIPLGGMLVDLLYESTETLKEIEEEYEELNERKVGMN